MHGGPEVHGLPVLPVANAQEDRRNGAIAMASLARRSVQTIMISLSGCRTGLRAADNDLQLAGKDSMKTEPVVEVIKAGKETQSGAERPARRERPFAGRLYHLSILS